MKKRVLGLLGLVFCFPASSADELPDYIRYREDAKSARLELAIRAFALPSGQKVDLIAVVHIADDAYYQELNRRLVAYDSVLFELVGDPKRLTASAPLTPEQTRNQAGGGMLNVIQQAAGRYLELTFQLDAIDYSGKNMVHADASVGELQKMQAERGETMVTLFGRAMQAQIDGKVDPVAVRELNTFALIRILMSPDSAAQFKKALAKMFAEMESLTAAMEGNDGSALLSGRNDVVVKKIKEVLAHNRQRHIAVFYGGAHMPGIEASLIKDLKAKAWSEQWLAAWTMPKQQPTAASKDP